MNDRLKEGTRVQYSQGGRVIGTGTIIGGDKRNGFAVYDVKMDDGDGFWGYRDQFVVIDRKKKG